MSQQNKPENFVENFAANFAKNFAPNCPPPKTETSSKNSLCRNLLLIKITIMNDDIQSRTWINLGFCKRGLANGVSPFLFLKMKRKKTQENGRQRKTSRNPPKKNNQKEKPWKRQKRKKTEKRKKREKRKKTGKKNGSGTVLVTPFAKSR